MAEVYKPLLHVSRSYRDNEIDEIQPMTSSTNLNSVETEVKTVVRGDDKSGHSATDTKPLQPGKEYHIFMSYSSEDRDDANTIRQHLEERFHLKCLYYERDFQIGKNIDENITDGLQKSMKALILLSPFYMQSHWCVTEAREACKLSFTDVENHNVIPVLLRPLSKDLPPFLNSYVYIDAQREMDVAGKIYEAFNQSALSCNGTLLVRKKAIKANFPNHGLAYRFSPLEAHEEEKISQNGVDPIECKKHVTTVMEDLNNKFLFRNYPVFSSLKWRCLLLCVLSTASSFIWVASFLYIYSKAYMFTKHWILNIFLGVPIPVGVCLLGLIIIYGCRRKDYLLSLLRRHRQGNSQLDARTNEEIVEKLIHQKLKELQSSQALIKWTVLGESAVYRHRTCNNRACICEMLEDHVNKTYGPVVIQV